MAASEIVLTNGVTPATPGSGKTKLFVDSNKKLSTVDDAGTVGTVFAGAVTGSALTMNTGKLLGRTTASSGAIEEITVAGGLSLSGGVLTAGALVLLEQHTASSSAQLDFTTFISSTYDMYVFQLLSILPATSTADLWIRMGTGVGPTYDTGGNYTWAYTQNSQIPNGANLGAAADTKIKIGNSLANTSTAGTSGDISFYEPQSTSVYKKLITQLTMTDSSGNFVGSTTGATYLSTAAVTGVRFLFSSGNIASGTIRVYGITK